MDRAQKKSAIQHYQDLRKDFREGRFKPIYLFYGGESYLPDRLQKILIEQILLPEDRDFNLDVVHGADVNIQSALNICQMAPMLTERRVVVIRGFEQLKGNKLFTSVAKQPNPAAVVLLICEGKPRFDMNPYRALKRNTKAVQTVEFAPLWRNQAPKFAFDYAKSQGYEMESRVQNLLVEFLGTGMALLAQEVEKLITYIGEREPKIIRRQDILQASGQTREINIFELQDAIMQRRALDAHQITEQLLLGASSRQGEALRIVSILSSYFLKLWKLHDFRAGRAHSSQLSKHTGISPNMVRRYSDAARIWPVPEVQRAIQLLLSVDSEIKGLSKRSPRLIMTLFITRLLSEPLQHRTR